MKKLFLLCLVIVFGPTAFAQTKITLRSNDKAECVKSDMTSLKASFSFSTIEMENLDTQRGQFSWISMPNTVIGGNEGDPQIPVINELIAVPLGANPTITVTSHSSTDYQLNELGIQTLIPRQPSLRKNQKPEDVPFVYNETAYQTRGLRSEPKAIVNVVGSAIAKAADDVIYTWAGPEIAVATTKAFSTQLSVIYLIALYIADLLETIRPEEYDQIVAELMKLDQKISLCLTPDNIARIRYYAEQYFKVHDAFFIGRNVDSAICLEGSLKLKEIAYIHSEAYPAGELKHGPISLIEDGTLVVAIATVDDLFDKTMSNVKEVRARGADVFGVTTEKHEAEIRKTVPSVITVPETHPMLQPSLTIIPLQAFAYHIALMRDCDVDKPRNLAKSVTVE